MRRLLFSFAALVFSLAGSAHEGENFVASDLTASMKPGDKAALLMVHFGTTHDDTRAKTIDAINVKAAAAFPELEVRQAYSSRIVINRLRARGIERQNPLDALLRLRADGYTHIIVQSTNIIEGAEMESLRRDVAAVKPFFTDIRVGNPLVYSTDDAEALIDILVKNAPAAGSAVFVGHGTYTPATATYAMLDHMMKRRGLNNYHVGTVEGYPTLEGVLAQLKVAKARQATIIPLLLVAGDHAKNDMAVDWRAALEKAGIKVEVRMQGLGEIGAIQDTFIERVRFALRHKMLNITRKKAAYAKGENID